ncbi:hypothetical protein ABE28_017620 [Peribacillus muralis]|uniref:Uncharacterized protein n=1 Tax=Peribacillus muralis TaxID=264697 RepID=A0A1B3XSJ5_9BACI|nr:hypothetical protein [Peribacillus muralis]AOH56186.1 hypothetical protein ABE28_017620 [Peribacillus muralis]
MIEKSAADPLLSIEKGEDLLQTIYDEKEHWQDLDTKDSPIEWKAMNHTILLQPIGAMDQIWAYLVMVLDRESDEFDFLILDRASLAISQDLLRKHYLDEKRLRIESTWLNDLLYRRINNEEQARGYISLKSKRASIQYRVAIVDIEDALHPSSLSLSDEENESAIYHHSLKIRSGFTKYSFTPYITSIRNQIIVLAIDLGTAGSSKARFLKVINAMLSVKEGESSQIRIGIGRVIPVPFGCPYWV